MCDRLQVLQAVVDWLRHDVRSRTASLARVLSAVRLPHIDKYFLFDVLDAVPELSETADCRRVLHEVVKFHALEVCSLPAAHCPLPIVLTPTSSMRPSLV